KTAQQNRKIYRYTHSDTHMFTQAHSHTHTHAHTQEWTRHLHAWWPLPDSLSHASINGPCRIFMISIRISMELNVNATHTHTHTHTHTGKHAHTVAHNCEIHLKTHSYLGNKNIPL